MCDFFSAISDGNGKVLFFTLDDIEKIEKAGNPNNYESWNSHTSIAHYNNIFGADEDKWNKWEYDCEKKELKADGMLNANDDSAQVKKIIERYLAKHNAIYCEKKYRRNTGDRNAGYRNTGDRNTGDRNAGNWNTGYRNTGNWNTGNWNTGDRNAGDWNTGDWNTGNLNTITPKFIIFNKDTKISPDRIVYPNYFYFDINVWIGVNDMSEEEKQKYWWYKTTGGYLRTISYKEAWKNSFEKASKEDVALTLNLPNFDHNIFEEISGITKKMIKEKLK
jgi:hypothetical protein